jgi:formylglycine-generating enzyme required for sulfatase activity
LVLSTKFAALAGTIIAFSLAPFCIASAKDVPGWSDEKPESKPYVEVDGKYMIPYVETLPGKEVSFVMIPVPGGEFLMGSPEGEADRNADEGPQVRVKVEPFWIGSTSRTWRCTTPSSNCRR